MRFSPAPRLLLLVVALAGCGSGDVDTRDASGRDTAGPLRVTVDRVPVPVAGTDTTASAVAGARAAIRTTNGGVEMAVTDDQLVVGLSGQVLARVREEMARDSAGSEGGAFGQAIAGAVKSAVQGALSQRLEYPLAEVEDARYEGGRLRITFRDGPKRLLEEMKLDGRPLLESFAPADAERFAEAVRAAKEARGVR